jgi:two-component system sensor histidine kinase/response regulator
VQKDLSLLSGKKILICEDNYLNTEIARELIEQKGMKAVCVSDGKQGCELFENSPENDFFAVLMDIRMPVMDGYTAARQIRSSGRKDAKTVFIAAMTADAFDDDISRTFEAGMNAHISKPIDPDRLYDALLSAYAEYSDGGKKQ